MNSRVIYDARDLSAPTVEVWEPTMDWDVLADAAKVRKYMQELRQRPIQSHP